MPPGDAVAGGISHSLGPGPDALSPLLLTLL